MELKKFHRDLDKRVFKIFDVKNSMNSKISYGGTAMLSIMLSFGLLLNIDLNYNKNFFEGKKSKNLEEYISFNTHRLTENNLIKLLASIGYI